MICNSKRPGKACTFMGPKKCIAVSCEFVVDKCGTCSNIAPDGYCDKYTHPKAKWTSVGGCPLNTNKVLVAVEVRKLNPIKASKKLKGK
jgi:hypothetical protein